MATYRYITTLLLSATTLLTSAQPSTAEVNADDTFSIMTLNVDGLPAKFLFFDVNNDGPQSEGSERISIYLAKRHCDIIAMQEDFNYRWEIWSRLFADYEHDEWTGGLGTEFKDIDWLHLQNERFPCDGLNNVWKTTIRSTAYERVPHRQSFGKFSHSFDDFITKGFRRHEYTLANGAEIVVYNTHFDASEGRDEAIGNDKRDREARISQWRQLRDHLLERLDSRPVIVVGDFNSYYRKDSIRTVFFDAIEATGRATVDDALVVCRCGGIYPDEGGPAQGERLDKILYINPTGGVAIEPVTADVDTEGYRYEGRPLGDHYPLSAVFRFTTPTDINTVAHKKSSRPTVYDLKGVDYSGREDDGSKRILIVDGKKVAK
jgi:endonuclease/exonuclease/phosphatase family metal-dependent hydrolase